MHASIHPLRIFLVHCIGLLGDLNRGDQTTTAVPIGQLDDVPRIVDVHRCVWQCLLGASAEVKHTSAFVLQVYA